MVHYRSTPPWVFAAVVALASAATAAQSVSGEIGGRLTDRDRSVLPGVRVTISIGDQSREAVTDREGRFSFPALAFGTYRVTAELAGFKAVSGSVTISAAMPIAFLTWSMEIGCLTVVDYVILGPKAAAPMVDTIAHIRVATAASPALISAAPDCHGRVVRHYSVEVLDNASARGQTTPVQRQLFMEPRGTELVRGQEYLALLWVDGSTTPDLVLPIASGRVVAPGAGELHGLRVRDALDMLAKWSEARRR